MNAARALVLSPAMPWWDDGSSVAPIVSALSREGISSDVVDTSELAMRHRTLDDVASDVARTVDLARYTVLAGNALGGTIALLLCAHHQRTTPVLSVSGPVRTEGLLTERLSCIVESARAGDVDTALGLLHRFVAPSGEDPGALTPIPAGGARKLASERLTASLSLLLDIDLIELLRDHEVRAVTLVGERSQLVREVHALHASNAEVVCVPGAGMRPHHEQPGSLVAPLKRLLALEVIA